MKYAKCLSCGNRAVLLTVGGNVLLALLKGLAGVAGSSHALLADGFHSAADVIMSLVIFMCARISEKGPDREHPYGHGKVELITQSVVTVGLMAVIVFLFKDAIVEINTVSYVKPNLIALCAAILAIIVSELMFRHNSCIGKELKSPAHTANAVRNRSDVYTSVIAVVGILGVMAGIKLFDPLAIIIIGVVMIKTFVEFLSKGYAGLMDTFFPAELKHKVVDAVREVEGVDRILFIKARCMGKRFWINLGIEVPSSLTVLQSFKICEMIKEAILFRVENIADVQIETKTGFKTA